MRAELPGIERSRRPFHFQFDGREIEAFPGETLAAALLNADIWTLRRTRTNAGRGIFCGMGACGECSVMVGGVQRRACLEYATPGAIVSTMPALAPASVAAPRALSEKSGVVAPDVLVVGAGPAGLAAAETSAAAGLSTLVVDERTKAGGQFFKQPGEGFRVDDRTSDRQFSEGAERIVAAKEAGARFLFGATVWSAQGPNEIMVAAGETTMLVKPRRIILSPGAFERPHFIPGWTLPGVMTTGAAQTLLRSSLTTPGRTVLIAGNGPLNLQVARELLRAGVDVVALVELASPFWRAPPSAGMALALNGPGLAWDGVRHLASLHANGVPIYYRHALIRAEGDEKVRRATIAAVAADGGIEAGTERDFEVDAICMGYGFLPQNEIARALGCDHRPESDGSLATVRDDDGRTSVAHVFLAGDAGGLGGARVAMAQGRIAADPAPLRQARRLLQRHSRFQRALWTLYRPPALPGELADPDTLVCRCEEISRAAVNAVLATGLASPGSVKRASRLGMGRCQGRYCGAKLASLIAEQTGAPVAVDEHFAPRGPFKPVTIGSIAALGK
jgi:NADPH-dependent 2,4-dienoyl-CoA reductase/sulfur reductase-like enzyme